MSDNERAEHSKRLYTEKAMGIKINDEVHTRLFA